MKLLFATALFVLAIIVAAAIPPFFTRAQKPPASNKAQQAPAPVVDTVLKNAKETIVQFKEAVLKVDVAAALVDSNSKKAQEIIAVLDDIKPPKPEIQQVRVFTPVRNSTTAQTRQPALKPTPATTIIYQACDFVYGGDTFRTDMWKAPGEDGVLRIGKSIKNLFKKKK